MKRFLIVVDMQKDFVDGALGTAEAVDIVPEAAGLIRSFDGEIFATYDTHSDDYLGTAEGKKLPVPHCIRGTDGWKLDKNIGEALEGKHCIPVEKYTFGSMRLPEMIVEAVAGDDFTIDIIGLCTDICVVSNALILKASFPEKRICVHASCCAGVTPISHQAALETMRSCQIDIVE